MAVDYSRIHRLLKILTLIQGSRGWTPTSLALECGTTERTIYRDMKMLEGAGIPYFYDTDAKSYAIRRDFFLPPVQLTLDEALALAALAEHVGGGEQVPFMAAASRAIRKVRCQRPASIGNQLEKIEDRVAIKLAAANPPESSADVYQTIQQALSTRRTLRCEYESLSKGAKGEFVFKPYTLMFNQRSWYVFGYHSQRKEVRCLKLNRFERVQPTDQEYEIPKDFSVKKHLGNAWRIIRGDKSYKIELEFDADFAETFADTHWHATQDVIWHEDHSITFTCTVDGLEEIVWWILGMGPHCVVRKPTELADRVRALAAAVVAKYPIL